jgi:3-(3-hydroxy-phenyl)propionate hydroxylase
VETPEGEYRIDAQWVLACDGSRSPLRGLLGQESHGRIFRDRFLIADVKMHADFPTERWFWFDPPFHPGQSVLLHRQPDDVWRIDFQLGWEADPEEEKKPENILPRIRALLGKDAHFELEWASVYTFACLRMDRFVHGRVVFAGDSAHGVSPFGARGANSGVQDAENLAWKLDRVLRGQADAALIATYGAEREYAADENIRNSTRATDFITPKSEISRLFRDAALELAREHEFARRIVNSGRLSVPATLHHSPLNTPDSEVFAGSQLPGAVLSDAPMRRPGDSQTTWLLRALGPDFTLLHFGPTPAWARELGGVLNLSIAAEGDAGAAQADLLDVQGLAAQRLDARPAPATCCAPTSMSARAGAVPTRPACSAAPPEALRAADDSLAAAALARCPWWRHPKGFPLF